MPVKDRQNEKHEVLRAIYDRDKALKYYSNTGSPVLSSMCNVPGHCPELSPKQHHICMQTHFTGHGQNTNSQPITVDTTSLQQGTLRGNRLLNY